MKQLSKNDRLTLMKFVCSFAWADLNISAQERAMTTKLMKKLGLDAEEEKLVAGWLEVPPAAEEVDPSSVPREHRETFLRTIRELIAADGEIAPDEAENYALFAALMR